MNTNGTLVDVELPCGLSACDSSLLQRCEGRVLFLKTVRARVPLSDVDYSSYVVSGVQPDSLSFMLEYRARFPAVVTRVHASRITVVVLGTAPLPAGVALQNTGPFDLCNGDSVCFLPPIFDGVCNRVRLESIDTDLIFPATVPSPLYGEILGKVIAKAVEAIGSGKVLAPDYEASSFGVGIQSPNHPFRDADFVTYNGRRYPISPCLRLLGPAEACVRSLTLNMIFSVTEGTMLLLSMIPQLLTLSADDAYVNALVGLETATRAAGQLIKIPCPRPYEDSSRRFPLYEALAAWIQMAQHMGETLTAKPMLKVCTFDGPSSIKPGETGPVIANWF